MTSCAIENMNLSIWYESEDMSGVLRESSEVVSLKEKWQDTFEKKGEVML